MVSGDSYIYLSEARIGFAKAGRETVVGTFHELSFNRGEFIAVVGPNGAGKSTLLRSICGLQPLLGGDIFLKGKKIVDYTLSELSTTVSIVLTQKLGGFNLKVSDAVAAGQMPYTDAFHRMRDDNHKVVRGAMERCGVAQYSHLPLHELSDGMFQKTMIARALAQQTPVMLLDEPSAFLDFASKHALFEMLRQLCAAEGKCVLISTHELDLVLKYCRKILLVNEGQATLMTTEEAKRDPGFLSMGGGHL